MTMKVSIDTVPAEALESVERTLVLSLAPNMAIMLAAPGPSNKGKGSAEKTHLRTRNLSLEHLSLDDHFECFPR